MLNNAWGKPDVATSEIQDFKKDVGQFFDKLICKQKVLPSASSSLATTSSELENLRSSYQELETKLMEAEQKREQAEKQLAEKNSELTREKGEFLLKRNADSETIKKQQKELNAFRKYMETAERHWDLLSEHILEPLGYPEKRRNQFPRDDLLTLAGDDCKDLISASRKICHNLSLKKSRTCGLRKLVKKMDILPELVTDLQASSARGAAAMTLTMCLAYNPELDLDRFNQFLEKEKLKGNGSNFTDWFRHVRIFLAGVSMQYVLDAPLGLEAELQKRFEHHDPCDMMRELKLIFETHAAVESYEASKQFFSCMMEEGSSVSEHMLAMSVHAKKLSDMGMMIPNQLGIHRVLQSLPPSYKNFVMNYNMRNMNKDLPELFSMLKSAEVEIKKENQVLMVNKTTSFKKQGKPNKGNFKKGGKKVAAHPEKPKAGPKPETVWYYCQGKGHWKRNCSKYLADLKSGHVKKKGEYLSYEFGMHLKKCGILSQLTPPGTPQRNGVSERRNRTLLDMVRSMMSLTDLPLTFWGYALETAAFTLNRAPSKSVETTPYELWFGKKPKMSFHKVWGCEAYVKKLQPDKLEPKAEKCVFIGYPKETIGYTFYHRSEGKIFVAKNGSFLEKEFLTKEVTGRKVELDEVNEPSLIDQSSAVPEEVPAQPTPIGEEANDDDHEASNEEATEPHRSTRERTTPDWYDPCLNVMIVDNNDEDPATYEEAMMSPDSNKWQEAMKSEMGSMYDNKVWTLVDLPDSRKAVENKWIFKRKTYADGNITVYKARLVIRTYGEACIYKKVSGSSVAFLILYVDDILLIGNDIELLSSVKGYLNKSFSMKDLGEAAYILGIKIYRDR
ncbi:uncharacterized protein LOC124672191, partial [Lolium rigidum]|uniref:uncharacterized protein LOC124672191 n=1 Tax=Lolium rigidum TaxID=89674 RepID=UPI001F5DD416